MNGLKLVPLLLLAASACSKSDDVAFAPTTVVSLYDARAKHPAGTPGVLVAEVGIGAKGAKLLSAPDAEVAASVKAALADLATRPFLPALGESAEAGGTSMGAAETKPGDEQYPWAVGGFLRERTGLSYRVAPYKPK